MSFDGQLLQHLRRFSRAPGSINNEAPFCLLPHDLDPQGLPESQDTDLDVRHDRENGHPQQIFFSKGHVLGQLEHHSPWEAVGGNLFIHTNRLRNRFPSSCFPVRTCFPGIQFGLIMTPSISLPGLVCDCLYWEMNGAFQ